MSLSDKTEEVEDRKGFEYSVIPTEDVKEFIKELKEIALEFQATTGELMFGVYNEAIDKLAGYLK